MNILQRHLDLNIFSHKSLEIEVGLVDSFVSERIRFVEWKRDS